jgi:hypothetical protein
MIQTGAPPIAFAVAAAERRLVRRLHERGAPSADRAQPLANLSGLEKRRLSGLVRAGAVRESEPGKYFMNAAGLEAYRHARRIRSAVFLAALVVVLAVIWGIVRR